MNKIFQEFKRILIGDSDTNTPMKETRNIIDHYHYWKHDDIVADLDSKRHNFTVLCSNLGNDFNIATVIRNANAFLAQSVWIYGNKQYDRRGTVGTHHYTHFRHFKEEQLPELAKEMYGMYVVGIDNVRNAKSIDNFAWPTDKPVLMVLGQEQIGIPENLLDLCDELVYIKQYGSVRSLNVGTASGIAMYDYCSKVCNGVQMC
jgi:tRNA G18 (ribose-2'-O)-methylase SpoU